MQNLFELLVETTENLIWQVEKRTGNYLFNDKNLDALIAMLLGFKMTLDELRDNTNMNNPDLIKMNQGQLNLFINQMVTIIADDDLSPFRHHISEIQKMVDMLID